MKYGVNIHLGQKIKIVYQNVTKQAFEEQRNEYHTGLQDDFWNNYKVASTRKYTVKPGQSVWTLAYDIHAIPIWLLQQQNPEVDLSKLHAGQSLVIPLVKQKENIQGVTKPQKS
jgi:membrane-bound lytic murein transglycosylase D